MLQCKAKHGGDQPRQNQTDGWKISRENFSTTRRGN
jgi:hypothetical protein